MLTDDRGCFSVGNLETQLLARIWINGEPFVPRAAPATHAAPIAHGSVSDELHFRFTLDRARIGAKPGDRVAIQLCACEDGWRLLDEPGVGAESLAGETCLTNRLELDDR